MARHKCTPHSMRSRWPISKPQYLRDAWTRLTYDAEGHTDPIRRFVHNAMDRPMDARKHVHL